MNTAIEQDLQARKTALNPNESFIVQAPAGSGKTELLIQRYLKLLANCEAPENIVAITFTRKAAGEMRERVLAALRLAKNSQPPESAHHKTTWNLGRDVLARDEMLHWDLLLNPSRMRIMTIDALSAELCQQLPILSGLGGKLRISDDTQQLYQDTADRIMTKFIQNGYLADELQTLLLHLNNQTAALQRLMIAMLSKREQWLTHIIGHAAEPEQLRTLLEQNLRQLVEELLNDAAEILDPYEENLLDTVRFACKNLDSEHPLQSWSELAALPEINTEQLNTWKSLFSVFLTTQGSWRKVLDKRQGFPAASSTKDKALAEHYKQSKQNALELLEQLRELPNHSLNAVTNAPNPFYSEPQWRLLNTLLECLPIFAAELQVTFSQQQCIDFIELNLAALRALGNDDEPTDLALRLDYQIQHLLIDEFQDTSLLQLQLLQSLIRGWEQQDGRTLFLVGDPMQSIYRFRNAEVGLFLQVQEQGLGHIPVTPLRLQLNFRSQPQLLNWYNQSFADIFPSDTDIELGAVPYHAVSSLQQAKDSTKAVNYYLHDKDLDTQSDSVTSLTQQLLKQDDSSSIAVLVRSRNHLQNIISSFKQQQIDFQAIDIESLGSRMEIQDLMSLTRALWHLGDRLSWLSVLRAPWCALCLHDLYQLSNANPEQILWQAIQNEALCSNLSADGQKQLARLRNTLERAFALETELSWPNWIQSTWLALGGPACLDSEEALQSSQQFFKLIHELYQQKNNASPDDLETVLNSSYMDNTNQHARVQLLTIHKSKGLEFDHVIIPGLARTPPRSGAQLLRWLERSNTAEHDLILAPVQSPTGGEDSIYQYLQQVEQQRLELEKSRLFYVAATRAKQSLHLMASLKQNEDGEYSKPPKQSFLGDFSDEFLDNAETVHTNTEAEKQLASSSLKALPLSWTAPVINSDSIRASSSFNNNDFKLKRPDSAAQLIGTFYHAIMHDLSKHPELLEAAAYWQQYSEFWLAKWQQLCNIYPRQTSVAIQPKQFIETVLGDAKAQWILQAHQNAESEWSLSLSQQGKIKELVLDRSFIDQDGIRWIIDYKTSLNPTDASEADFLQDMQQQYQRQLNQYAAALQALEPEREIRLALYFPLQQLWHEWVFQPPLIASVT